MAEQEIFRGFFSYARDDGETDPPLITALTTELERRINARLVNARKLAIDGFVPALANP